MSAAPILRRWRPVAALALALLMAGCATTSEPKIVVQTVKVPVPVPCRVDLGPEPAYADSDEALKAAPNVYEWGKLLVAGRLQRIARDKEKDAALKACAG